MRSLPILCPGGTVVCLASGPSLTVEDVEFVRGKATVIAVNDAVRLAPWADVIYSSDQIWWSRHYKALRASSAVKVRVHASKHVVRRSQQSPLYCDGCQKRLLQSGKCWCEGIITLYNAGERGLSLEPDTICTAENSGGAAINVAVLLGATRILLLGYDMGIDAKGRRHFYDTGATWVNSPFPKFRKLIATMADPLKAAGIEVVNCSRQTALECFPTGRLEDALAEVAA